MLSYARTPPIALYLSILAGLKEGLTSHWIPFPHFAQHREVYHLVVTNLQFLASILIRSYMFSIADTTHGLGIAPENILI